MPTQQIMYINELSLYNSCSKKHPNLHKPTDTLLLPNFFTHPSLRAKQRHVGDQTDTDTWFEIDETEDQCRNETELMSSLRDFSDDLNCQIGKLASNL